MERFGYRRFKKLGLSMLIQLVAGQLFRIGLRMFITCGFITVFDRFGWYNGPIMAIISTILSWLIGRFVAASVRRRFDWDEDIREQLDDLIDGGYELIVRIKNHFHKG